MAAERLVAGGCRRRLLVDAPKKGGGGGSSSPDGMRIMVGVLVTVIVCTLLYCVYCWRWRKRNDPSKSAQLGWNIRHNIILGIARGMLYLHEDSLLKVVHRDLKASNVLLDRKMSPKISDFGMAKIFEEDSDDGINTGRVVGTYGYMAPEFALEGVLLRQVRRLQLRRPPAGDLERAAQRRVVPGGAPAVAHPRCVEAVDGRPRLRVHGPVAGPVLLQGGGVALLPRWLAVRAGGPRRPANHVHRPAHAHQRPHGAPGPGHAAVVYTTHEEADALGAAAHHQDRVHGVFAVHQRRLHHRNRATMRLLARLLRSLLAIRK